MCIRDREKALQLAKAAADRDSYAAACLLAAYEKDKACLLYTSSFARLMCFWRIEQRPCTWSWFQKNHPVSDVHVRP